MKKKIHYRKLLLIIVIALALTIGITTLAKYVIEEYHDYFLTAKNFYFTSNRLKKDEPVYLVNNWSGVGSFDISFDLLSEKNSLVYSNYDIPYTVTYTCPNDVVCTLDKQSGTIYSASLTHSDTVTLSVSPTRAYNENERLSIYVESESTSPYKEKIKARFEYVVGKKGVTYEIEDEPNRVYLMLKITNAITYCTVRTAFGNYSVNDSIDVREYRNLDPLDKPKCVSKVIDLSFNPSILVLDTTDNIVDVATYTTQTINGIDYVNGLSFKIDPASTVAIKFYKGTPANNYTYPITNQNSIIGVNIHD